jgi:cbb3-type cytochrome oxidase subunit 3
MTLAAFSLAGGAWIFLAFLIVFLLAVVYGLYTTGGSGINQRPHGSVYSSAPGARIPSTLSHDQSAASRYTRGTR